MLSNEQIVRAKYPKACSVESSAYGAWIIVESPSSNHVLSVKYPAPATAGTEEAAWQDAAQLLASRTQAEQPAGIPEDLRELYGVAQAWRHSYGSKEKFGSGTVEVLIERIAQAEAENRRLREALEACERHIEELRDAFERGALASYDSKSAERSNRNMDMLVKVRAALGGTR